MPSTNLGFDHVHLLSGNPKATADWYVENLGATLLKNATIRGAPQIYVGFDGFIVIVRGQRESEQAPKKADLHWGIDHFGLRVSGDFDGFCDELQRKGVTFSLPPTDFNPTTRIAFIDAPDGVSVELVSRSETP